MPAMNPNQKALRDGIVLLVILQMLFAVWPGLDLLVSGLFYDPSDGFWIAHIEAVQSLRELIWRLIVLGFAAACVALIFTKLFRSGSPMMAKVWEVIVLTYVLGPMLLVDGILKRFWGRARPANVTEFGGTADFTPAYQISDQCAKNCSFVSGEGAGATALLIAVFLVTRNTVPTRYTRWVTWIGCGVAAAGLGLRLLMGRHFLSDTVFAMLFVTLIALALLQLKRYRDIRLF